MLKILEVHRLSDFACVGPMERQFSAVINEQVNTPGWNLSIIMRLIISSFMPFELS